MTLGRHGPRRVHDRGPDEVRGKATGLRKIAGLSYTKISGFISGNKTAELPKMDVFVLW